MQIAKLNLGILWGKTGAIDETKKKKKNVLDLSFGPLLPVGGDE